MMPRVEMRKALRLEQGISFQEADAEMQQRVVYERVYEDAQLPVRATGGSAGYDVFAYLRREHVIVRRRNKAEPTLDRPLSLMSEQGPRVGLVLHPRDLAVIPLGFKASLPRGVEAQVRPRSGLAFKQGLEIPNAPGTIDEDYPDEWGVIVKNASESNLYILHGDKIAQVVFNRYAVLSFHPGCVGVTTERTGGFGSTG